MIGPEDIESSEISNIPKQEWVEKLNQVKLAKTDLNKLIMNFFLIEGKQISF